MLRKLRPRLSFANVTSLLALFVALGGTGAYAVNEWNGSNIQDESLTGLDVKGKAGTATAPAVNGSLTTHDIAGQGANTANGTPFIDGTLTTFDIADATVRSDDIRDDSLGAVDLHPSSVATSEIKDGSVTKPKLAATQAWQSVNAPDDTHCNGPASGGYFSCFNNFGSVSSYWGNDVDPTNNAAAYYKDPSGVVHLKGIVCRAYSGCADLAYSGNETMLYLPTAYRPAKDWFFHTESSSGEALIAVRPSSSDGTAYVDLVHGHYGGVSLDGIEFRACGEPGSEAC